MLEISSINLENEMDLPLTNKRAVNITKYLGLTLSTQTTFATGVAEVCRAVLEKTLNSTLYFKADNHDGRWFLEAQIITDTNLLTEGSQELKYARRLIPVISIEADKGTTLIHLRLGLPQSVQLGGGRLSQLIQHIKTTIPVSAYEEIKLRNQELFTLAEEREEQLRLVSMLNEKKSEFLSIASHELKTPLTVIKAYAQIGKTFKDKDPGKMADYMDKINDQATKVNSLIHQLLDVAKIEANKADYRLERVEFTGFLEDVLASTGFSHPGHPLAQRLGEPVWIDLDKLRIEQVMINLVGNAAKYSPGGNTITVSLLHQEPGYITVAVTDEGIGLSKDNITKVFDKFFRAEDVAQKVSGLGMGLYITSRIVKEHHGKIWVESEENKGSTFYFTLPLPA